MTEVHDVAIVGGGVVGLSIAYALARAGLCPAVLDRRELGREASWAGAGLIPPDVEGSADRPPSGLRSFSAGLYPGWATELEQETAIDVGYRRTGGVDVAFTESEDQVLRAAGGPRESRANGWRRRMSAGSSRSSTGTPEPSTFYLTALRSGIPVCCVP